jgi:hypothetical protein
MGFEAAPSPVYSRTGDLGYHCSPATCPYLYFDTVLAMNQGFATVIFSPL